MTGTPARTHRGDDVPYNPGLPETLQYVSSTQIKQFRECKRKWFFAAVRKRSAPSTAAMTLGQDVHTILEEYAKTGLPFPERGTREVEIAREALQYLPEWANDWQPEVNIGDPTQGPQLTLNGVPFVSYIDLVVPPRHENERIEPVLVIDYKTTKDLKYVKSAAQLRDDIQVIGYARWATEKFLGVDWDNRASLFDRSVRVLFPYLLTAVNTKGPRSQCVDLTLRLDELVKPWVGFERDVVEMLDYARRADELEDAQVPPNWSSCDAWGGCPHRTRCDKLVAQSLNKQLVSLRTSKEGALVTTQQSLSDLLAASGAETPPMIEVPVAPLIEHPGFDLYIDTVPVRGNARPVLLEEYLQPLTARVVQDWNEVKEPQVSDVLEIDFGKWKGPLRTLLIKHPPSGAVLARSFGEMTQVALEVLRPMARSVWQGVR